MILAKVILQGGYYKDATFPAFPSIGMELNLIFFGTTDIKTVKITKLVYNLDPSNFMSAVYGNIPSLLVYVDNVLC
jgi:hypothetical protein